MADLQETNVPQSEDDRESLIDAMTISLQETLYCQAIAKFAHWNVKGAGFFPAHKLFDQVAEFLADAADTIAERQRALGMPAYGRIEDVFHGTSLSYDADENNNVGSHMKALAELLGRLSTRYQGCIESCPEADMSTQDVYITLQRELDKLIYFVQSDTL